VDVADPAMIMNILRQETRSYAFSARTGFGLPGLLHAIESSLPILKVEIEKVIPYSRGDLVSAIHERGEIISEEYVAEGTAIHARVDAGLAKQMQDLV
jgi:GTP-binding protein HflX